MASSTLSALPISSSNNISRRCIPPSSFTGSNLPILRFSSSNVVLKCRRPRVVRVSSSLPTKEYHDLEKVPKWSARAIRSYGLAELEARTFRLPETGTECLLLGILLEGTSSAAKLLRANGITIYKVRDEIINLLGKRYFLSAVPEFPPVTDQGLRALDRAIEEKLKSGKHGEITPSHVLLAIWSDPESVGHQVLKTLGFTDEKTKELLNHIDEGAAAAVLSSR